MYLYDNSGLCSFVILHSLSHQGDRGERGIQVNNLDSICFIGEESAFF